MPQVAAEYKVGDKVAYHPIGGASANVSSSQGEIVDIQGSGEEVKYGIKNNKTGKITRYRASQFTNNLPLSVTH
ncbi:hypothetical protein JB92DRAFT_3104297 [Gautieria morchelliformis]|nr:hypothetical protein JB92DRAFT_3104297 [Gautieria morchelliformis]